MEFKLEGVRYGSILFIEDLTIEKGKVTAIIGKSGGGKSTLLKLLNKSLSPDYGTIHYDGEPLSERDSVLHRRKVLYLNQNPMVFDGTIKDNLLKGFMYQRRALPDDERLENVLRKVRLELSFDQSASKLSGGEAQRLALGRILLLDAETYLFDEPSSALDEKSELDVLNSVIAWLRSSGKTVVMVTHSKDVALKHADRILALNDGTIEEVETHE